MKTVEDIYEKLNNIHKDVLRKTVENNEILTLKDAAIFLSISESSLYKKTSKKEIPFSCPSNGKIYFLKEDLLSYMKSNRISSNEEITKKAINHLNQTK